MCVINLSVETLIVDEVCVCVCERDREGEGEGEGEGERANQTDRQI